MYDVFTKIRNNLEGSRRIPTRTLLTLNPSSQVCYDMQGNQLGSCLRQVWLEKNDQPKSNAIGVNAVMAGFSGNWWEDWFIDKLKEVGMYYNHSIPLTDVTRLVKGIADVIVKDPATGRLELGEVKTYDGSNYYGSTALLGNTKTPPKPKDKHLLQAFRYSLIAKEHFEINNLFYIDRACGSFNRNKQFQIELFESRGKLYPKISTIWNNEHYEYVDTRISDDGIYRAEEALLTAFSNNEIPEKEFIESFSQDIINAKFASKEIPQYVYDKYVKDPANNPIGDIACKYCAFSKGTCNSWS